MSEIWVPTYWRPEMYEVSNLGRVRNHVTGRIKKSSRTARGYWYVHLKGQMRALHRVVALSFNPEWDQYAVIRHLNDQKDDNTLMNLAPGSQAENLADALRNGRLPIGRAHPNSKLDENQVRVIKAAHRAGLNQRRLGKIFGVGYQQIARIISGQQWKHVP